MLNNNKKKVAIIGASGLVGRTILKILEERNFPVSELLPIASQKSVGKEITFNGVSHKIISIEDALAGKPDIAFFSAGSAVSLEWAPFFVEAGAIVIDSSSAWRLDPSKKIIIPEVNGSILTKEDKIIAKPNCSTTQLVLALYPLHKEFGIKRIVVSTYQSVTGTGKGAVDQLMNERRGVEGEMAYAYPIDLNLIPQVDIFLPNGYTKEEMKMENETRKILGDESICITTTAVRIPVIGGHSESVNVEFKEEYDLEKVRSLLSEMPGVVVVDDVQNLKYPMPIYAEGKDEVFVGRLRRDESNPKTLNMWIVADNLRKGAATNAVQIAEYLCNNNLI
ncbi:aspartate-semialdehyde dehydrogenase [Candidatus Nomurabacteria bacterium RIFCSPLOWO2_02_40_28]|uniref:Aspartate-semialdehyde dehydrogenase n=2 Tax=Candidatus Nomuraibacteriota TaxID=1752729 RepID=A0A837HV73_9BACT|nr:MAG: Aspartate-semialdehyde dehydrogenase [Candidatus Nomurabacteria bacterium GW2011_GWD2_39_12]KKR21019.1 MAG: Aspartate-semialdehyde dehydrogenase [Candidatus Nomurabacteria bacterium GW2011_GWC2_39_41]KKR37022.1 MAG: Aspartate-semialdehyde dehydrogenase [Candidatus Nomurabacteria bacterium GW2011_GWE2_40_10]KKR38968.1 MAG: Aspartate-semialdehyde dehydrogenase [Candidatus Nomurabacteria bacterium GW2011_GWB1_40_11]KKR40210.1 MAG: Aspartate-semialdehyde dehydrogenase [Parcubacteria group b